MGQGTLGFVSIFLPPSALLTLLFLSEHKRNSKQINPPEGALHLNLLPPQALPALGEAKAAYYTALGCIERLRAQTGTPKLIN